VAEGEGGVIEAWWTGLATTLRLSGSGKARSRLGTSFETHYNLGTVGRLVGAHRITAALALLERPSIRSNPADQGLVLLAAGSWQAECSAFADGLQSFETALGIFKKLGDDVGAAVAVSNIGALYLEIGHGKASLEHCNRAMTLLADRQDASARAVCLHNLGNAHDANGDRARALHCYRQALESSREASEPVSEARILIKMGCRLSREEEREDAMQLLRKAATICRLYEDRFGEAEAIHHLAMLLRDEENGEVCELLQQALAIRRQIGDRSGEAHSLEQLRDALAESNQISIAVIRGKQAVQTWQSILSENAALQHHLSAFLTGHLERDLRALAELLRRTGRHGDADRVDRFVDTSASPSKNQPTNNGPPMAFEPEEREWLLAQEHDRKSLSKTPNEVMTHAVVEITELEESGS